MKDYRVNVTVKNNRLLSAIEREGYGSPFEFANQWGIPSGVVYDLINMKSSPVASSGHLRKWVPDICEALAVLPEDIFSQKQMYESVKTNVASIEVDASDVACLVSESDSYLMDKAHEQFELNEIMGDAIKSLSENEQKVIKKRFGIEDEYEQEYTLDDIAKEFSVTRERIRQIECRAIEKLKNTSIRKTLSGYTPDPKFFYQETHHD